MCRITELSEFNCCCCFIFVSVPIFNLSYVFFFLRDGLKILSFTPLPLPGCYEMSQGFVF